MSIRLSRIVCCCGEIRRQVGNGRRAISAQRNRLPEPSRNPRLIAEHFSLNHAGISVSGRQRENPDDGVIGVGLAHQRRRVKRIAVFIHHAHVRNVVAGDEVEGNLIRRGGRGNRRGEARCRRCDGLRLRAAGQRRGNRALQVAQEAGIAVRNQQKPHHEQANHQHDGNHHRQRALLAARRFLFHVLLRAHELVLQVIPTRGLACVLHVQVCAMAGFLLPFRGGFHLAHAVQLNRAADDILRLTHRRQARARGIRARHTGRRDIRAPILPKRRVRLRCDRCDRCGRCDRLHLLRLPRLRIALEGAANRRHFLRRARDIFHGGLRRFRVRHICRVPLLLVHICAAAARRGLFFGSRLLHGSILIIILIQSVFTPLLR